MNRIALFATIVGVSIALPLDAQGRGREQTRRAEPRTATDIRIDAARRAEAERERARRADAAHDDARREAANRARSKRRGPADVPQGHWPSEGRCRVWIDGVAPGQQPRETDCATAYRTVPANGRVLVGSARTKGRGNGDDDRDDERRDRGEERRDRDDDPRGRDDDRRDRDDDRRGRDDERDTRRFIDRNGMECEEKRVIKDGRRSYDLKCREPKDGRRTQDGSWPVSVDDRYCVDANRDGRCDAGMNRGYPSTLPDMIGAVVFGQGERTDEVARWLGTGRYHVRYTDANRDKRPERVRWLDGAGVVLQEWMDTNRDGRADVVNFYRGGRIVQSVGGR